MRKRLVRLATAGAATAGIALTAVLGTAGDAAASTVPVGHVKLCAGGNYKVYVVWSKGTASSDDDVQISSVIAPGTCTGDIALKESDPELPTSVDPLYVRGVYNTSNNTFLAGVAFYDGGTSGLGITAKGTTVNAGAGAYITTW
ncbi:hypothetical protein OG568_61165 (plasmid) [Streptomyces sp. NBC_01450]|uniref:hypothetical protein n=1 Tax=Streptomyces sp. NBC_01450 TaxID=2903871 RepID=UPI002E3669C7|nr:hypothetical protein [Streptomyces sp. NBC_01450]